MPAPILSLVFPTPGMELNGTETLIAHVQSTGTGVLGVGWSIDGIERQFIYAPSSVAEIPPIEFVLDTTTLTDGPHTVTVVAQDFSNPGIQATPITVPFTVANAHPSPRVVFNEPADNSRVTGDVLFRWTPTTRGATPIWFTSLSMDKPPSDPTSNPVIQYGGPYRLLLDTSTLSNGPHTVYVNAVTTDEIRGQPAAIHIEVRNAPAHPPISRYGTFRTPQDITIAVLERLRDWQPEYTRVVGTAKRVDLRPLRAVIPMTDLQRYPENKLPCAIVVVGPTNTPPLKNEKGYYSATYSLVVGVVASTTSEEDTRRTVELYGQVVKMCLAQRRKLADDVVVESWTGESTDPLQVSEKRRLLVHTVAFNVRLDNVFSWKEGPGPTAEPPAPADPPLPEWPPVIWTEADLTIQKEPIT